MVCNTPVKVVTKLGFADYKAASDRAKRELEVLLTQRDELDRKIAELKIVIGSIARLTLEEAEMGKGPLSSVVEALHISTGLTDACRDALKLSPGPIAVRNIRRKIEEMGIHFEDYRNPWATLSTVLQRLVKAGEAKRSVNKQNLILYEWIGSAARLSPSAHKAVGRPQSKRKSKAKTSSWRNATILTK